MNNNFTKILLSIQDGCSDLEYMYNELMDENNELRLDKERLEEEVNKLEDHIMNLEEDMEETLSALDND